MSGKVPVQRLYVTKIRGVRDMLMVSFSCARPRAQQIRRAGFVSATFVMAVALKGKFTTGVTGTFAPVCVLNPLTPIPSFCLRRTFVLTLPSPLTMHTAVFGQLTIQRLVLLEALVPQPTPPSSAAEGGAST